MVEETKLTLTITKEIRRKYVACFVDHTMVWIRENDKQWWKGYINNIMWLPNSKAYSMSMSVVSTQGEGV